MVGTGELLGFGTIQPAFLGITAEHFVSVASAASVPAVTPSQSYGQTGPVLTALAFVFAGLRDDTDSRRTRRVLAAVTGGILLSGLVSLALVHRGTAGLGIYRGGAPVSKAVLLLSGLLTQLGDPWFLVLVAVLFYLLGTERSLVDTPREGAFVLAVTFGAFALTDLLKSLFALPRPPGAGTVGVPPWLPTVLAGAFRNVTTGAGYGFPSGHALGTTAVYGALAYRLNVSTERVRWIAAAAIIGLIGLSRVVLGVHYPIDVIAGILAGLALLGTAVWAGADRPLRTFAIAIALAVGAVVATVWSPGGTAWSAGQWLGATLGAGGAWFVVRPSCELDLRGTAIASAIVGGLWGGTYLLSPTFVLTVVAVAVASALTVGAPSLAARLR